FGMLIQDFLIQRLQWAIIGNRSNSDLDNQDKFCSLIEAIPQMAWISNPAGEVLYFNKVLYDYTGVIDIAKWKWQNYIHNEDFQRTYNAWVHSLKSGENCEIEYRWVRHDGETRWMLGKASPIKDAYGKIFLWIGTA